jgi:phage portal protein BeeE
MAQSRSLANQLTSFFSAMYWRMIGRATGNNPAGANHIGSMQMPVGDTVGAGQSGNMGGGAIPIGSLAVYPDPNTIGYIKFAFSGNATVYTIVTMIARKFAYIPRYVYEVQDVQAMRQYKHFIRHMDSKNPKHSVKMLDLFKTAYKAITPKQGTLSKVQALAALLERPNPKMGQDTFFELADVYFEVAGECMIWCNRGADAEGMPIIEGEILEMYVLPPQYLEMVPDPLNVWGSLGWVFNVAGKRIPIDDENIIHIRKPNPNFDGVTREHMRGMSPLRPANKKLTEDESSTDASVALNQNLGAKGIAYDQTPGQMAPAKETAIRNSIDKKVNNRDAFGSVAYIQGLLGYIDLASTSVEMDLETRKDNLFDRLCNVFGAPPDLFKTGQTYQNLIQARKDLITNKTLPTCCIFRDEMNRVLLPAFGLAKDTVTVDVDATMIIELQDDMNQLVNSLLAAYWLTPNQRLKEMNQPQSDAEGMDDVWIPNTLVRMEDAAQPMPTPGDMASIYGSPAGNSDNSATDEDEKTGDQDELDDQNPTPKGKGKANARGKNKGNK